jgi:hypothetical protein
LTIGIVTPASQQAAAGYSTPSWETSKAHADIYTPACIEVLQRHFARPFGVAPATADMRENTDLISVDSNAPLRVACRVRRFSAAHRYSGEFTLRAGRESGTRTELDKVLSGHGDVMLYAWAAEVGPNLCAWVLIDLDEFRRYYNDSLESLGVPPGLLRANRDGTAFRSYRLDNLPGRCILSRMFLLQ